MSEPSLVENPSDYQVEASVCTDPHKIFLREVQDDVFKRSLTTANESLRSLLTLSTALLAGSLAIFRTGDTPLWFRGLIILSFLAAVVVSMIGVIPFTRNVPLFAIYEFEKAFDAAVRWKETLTRIAGGVLALGLIAAAFGVLFS